MKRRSFLSAVLGGAAAGWSTLTWGQQPGRVVIGFLGTGNAESEKHLVAAFSAGLSEAGYVAGDNVTISLQVAAGSYEKLPALATDFVRQNVALIAASGPPAALAAKAAASKTPVLFVIGYDPVRYGLVSSINHPGENVTGATFFTGPLGPKRLDLLNQFVPGPHKIGMLVNPNSPTSEGQVHDVEAAARALGRGVYVYNASTDTDLQKAFPAFLESGVRAVMLGGDGFFMSRRETLTALAAHHQLPVIYDRREYAEVGGLLSYGTSLVEAYRKIGVYAGRILKGERPGNLPVQQATKFELIVNLKTAKSLGIVVPQSLLVAADEVIE